MNKNTPIAAALFGLALIATPALADEVHSVRVEYQDLDLTSAQGQRTLERRLETAARDVCGYNQRVTGSLLPSARSRTCYKQATSRAKDVMATAIDNANADNRMGG